VGEGSDKGEGRGRAVRGDEGRRGYGRSHMSNTTGKDTHADRGQNQFELVAAALTPARGSFLFEPQQLLVLLSESLDTMGVGWRVGGGRAEMEGECAARG